MNLRRLAAAPALLALLAGLSAVVGCNKKPTVPIVAGNQPPTVRITSAPRDTTQRNYYVITLNWIGNDPDGRVDHFLYAIDPPRDPGVDTTFTITNDYTMTHSFPCPSPDLQDSLHRSADFHVFVIKAVDNLGAVSPPVARAFWSFTEAPRVEVRIPPASSLVRYYVTPSVLLAWEGFDDDGVFTQKPVKYKFKMLTDLTEVTLTEANLKPDRVRQYYAPRFWAGWDSLPGDTTQKQYTGLDVDHDYMFVIVAFDEAGAYSPIFSRNTNMVLLRVTYSGAQNPVITFFNEFFTYTYAAGSYRPTDPAVEIPLEVPAGRPGHPEDRLTFNWFAEPVKDRNGVPLGGPIRSYRWAVDILNVFDDTQRSDEELDLAHWSQPTTAVTSCRIGPYAGGECHKFYLETEDINHLRSLGIVRFCAVQATFEKELLIVDDTRYLLDEKQATASCVSPPKSNWPTAAELDTFLYAKGGVPWKCYPAVGGQTQLSSPGIFAGYDFDTVGTNLRIQDLTIKLATLGRYRHLIWIVNAAAANNDKPGTDAGDISGPTTSMRYMNANAHSNTIAAYVRQGGLVWLAGGGSGTASMINFNKGNNDNVNPIPRTITFSSTNKELVPGRFLYDQAHWRSEFKQYKLGTVGRIQKYLGRFRDAPRPEYLGLPNDIQFKTTATDPFPPNRTGSTAVFYQQQFDGEFLTGPNDIIEDLDTGAGEDFQSTLDTLYKTIGSGSLPPDTGPSAVQCAIMTYYHGLENSPFLFTGFNLWNFRRGQIVQLVDAVMNDIWGVFRTSAPTSIGLPGKPSSFSAGARGFRAPDIPRAAPLRPAPRAVPRATPAASGSRN